MREFKHAFRGESFFVEYLTLTVWVLDVESDDNYHEHGATASGLGPDNGATARAQVQLIV